jgi:hypothetical protein
MGPHLDEATTVADHDAISSPNRRQAMGHHDDRPARHQSLKRLLDLSFGSGIEV